MDVETAHRLTDAVDRELADALDVIAFLATRWPALVRSRRRELDAIAAALQDPHA